MTTEQREAVRQKAREWRTTQRTYPAQRGTSALLVTPEQFDEALAAFAESLSGGAAPSGGAQPFIYCTKCLQSQDYVVHHDTCHRHYHEFSSSELGGAPPAASPQPAVSHVHYFRPFDGECECGESVKLTASGSGTALNDVKSDDSAGWLGANARKTPDAEKPSPAFFCPASANDLPNRSLNYGSGTATPRPVKPPAVPMGTCAKCGKWPCECILTPAAPSAPQEQSLEDYAEQLIQERKEADADTRFDRALAELSTAIFKGLPMFADVRENASPAAIEAELRRRLLPTLQELWDLSECPSQCGESICKFESARKLMEETWLTKK